jgi:hypothetical protein
MGNTAPGKAPISQSDPEWEIMVPMATGRVTKAEGAPGLKTLDGKRVGLFWNTKPNGDVFLLRIGERLKERFENIQLIEFMPGKADSAIGAPAVALKEAATRCDAVLLSTGD